MSLSSRATEARDRLIALKQDIVQNANSRWIEFHFDRLIHAEVEVELYDLAEQAARPDSAFAKALGWAADDSRSTNAIETGIIQARRQAARHWIKINRLELSVLDKQALLDLFFTF